MTLPLGKLPPDILASLLSTLPMSDSSVLLGPGPGLDCAVLDVGDKALVLTSDPITFTAGDLGWYLVQINVNDIATTGARPRWLLVTLLFPESKSTEVLVRDTFEQLAKACLQLDITLVGGHTEVTQGIDRPIAVGTLIGQVAREDLVTPKGARPGDGLLLTKFVPIEAVAILCQEFPEQLSAFLSPSEIERGARHHLDPGISVLREAQIACASGSVSAMHDPTEGGLAAAIWELADACGQRVVVDLDSVPVSALARRVCDAFQIDPLAAISSGALLITAPEPACAQIGRALHDKGIPCTMIGRVEANPPGAWQKTKAGAQPLPRPERDELARLFDRM